MAVRKIRVLIVDDSAVVRQTLTEILSSDPEIEVIGCAGDPFVAADRIAEQTPRRARRARCGRSSTGPSRSSPSRAWAPSSSSRRRR